MNKWNFVQHFPPYVDFDKEVLICGDKADTTLDVRLSFNTETLTAYMAVAWHSNTAPSHDLGGEHDVGWEAALCLVEGDAPQTILELLHSVSARPQKQEVRPDRPLLNA